MTTTGVVDGGVTGPAQGAWVDVGDGYDLTLRAGKLVCRNQAGKLLRSVPKAVRERPEAERLIALRDWLEGHSRECQATVETWMLGSFPVPATLLAQVWADPAWRTPLTDLVVQAGDQTGLLRGVDDRGRLGVLDLDAETRWLTAPAVAIPHPVLLTELADLRELALELRVEQAVPQLTRETYARPDGLDPAAAGLSDYAGAQFEQLRHATSRAQGNGFTVRGGYATCPAYEGAERVFAHYWLGEGDPSADCVTGDLHWVDAQRRPLPLGLVGPVAWSEGVRMAALIHAGRRTEGVTEAR